jgi:hypothetical protein
MTCFSGWRSDCRHPTIAVSLCCCLTAASFFPLNASAQQCRGNPNIGCTNAGAKCSSGDVQEGHCKTTPNLPRGERECVCAGSPPPPVTIHPKYVVAGLVYAPPGCTSSTPGSACSQPGSVDYSSASSLGTKITTADSFKNGVKVTASFGSEVSGGSGSFAWSRTTGDTQSANLTKSGSLEIKVPGNADGINHDDDMFILLLNPTVTLSSDGAKNIYWQPGYSGDAAARYEVYVSELRNLATMRPAVAAVLKEHGFTAADYKTIRCLDQFAGPGIRDGVSPDYCEVSATTGGPSPGLDLNRFRPTTWILPYEPPRHASDLCPSITPTLKNDYASENAKSTQDEYTVSAEMHAGIDKEFDLKIEGEMTWTSSETDSNSQGSTQSASLTLVCPSVAYTGPTLFQVYWDVHYGTFLLMPFDPASMEIIQHGAVTDAHDKPVAAVPITLQYGGRTYHTFTTASGTYRFIGLKRLLKANLQNGTIVVRNKKLGVHLRSQSPSTIRLQ